jgi:hypothetical protein
MLMSLRATAGAKANEVVFSVLYRLSSVIRHSAPAISE